ncbi:hypothetical protein EA473_10175 [Natrarchaeobius chitinivorans]|uniref:Uncharacterized protein n=1 Tax=Natrarchaeobius chitinivorans TaxID=1679083 RepID=A0A3N6MKN9_NATCH|nr:hypothetical protein EA473_10175 [Natrarchaeobius chitinivorans]
MYFETEAYIDEYVIDGENTGTFTGDTTSLTYTPEDPDTWPSFLIPTDRVSSITVKRDSSLQRNRFLGWFFAVITGVLILAVYVQAFAGQLSEPRVDSLTVFMVFLIVGGVATTREYFSGDNPDVIAIFIRTDDGGLHLVYGRMRNTEFVEACGQLIESDIKTRNQNPKLERELGITSD